MQTKLITFALLFSILSIAFLYVIPIQYANAIGFTYFNSTKDNDQSIVRIGNFVWVGGLATNAQVCKFTLTGTLVTCITHGSSTEQFYVLGTNSGKTRLYGFIGTGAATGNLVEIDIVNNAILRELVTGCGEDDGTFFDTLNDNFYCGTSGDLYKRINLNSMTITYTSSTVNAGTVPCVDTVALTYVSSFDTMFASCTGPSRVVAIEGFSSSGTPDFALAVTNPRSLAYNDLEDNILVGADGTNPMTLANYTQTVGFTSWQTYTTNTFGTTSMQAKDNIKYDILTDRYFAFDQGSGSSSGIIYVIDGTEGNLIFSTSSDGANIGAEGQFYIYSSTLAYGVLDGTTVATHDYFEFDMTGIEFGEGAGGSVGASVCNIDTNFDGDIDIVYRDIGGPNGRPDANGEGGVPDGICDATPIAVVIGPPLNQTGSALVCSIGLIACDEFGNPENPDTSTNGVGYLFVVIGFGIMVGMFFVATKGDLKNIPAFVWMLSSIALLGAFTAFGFLQVAFFIVGILIMIALFITRALSTLELGFK